VNLINAFMNLGLEPPAKEDISAFQKAAKERGVSLEEFIVELSAILQGWIPPEPPKEEYFRHGVPLPDGLTTDSLRQAMIFTQRVLSFLNTQTTWATKLRIDKIIQKNNVSGIVSNILTEGLGRHTPFKRYSDQSHPDLINPNTGEGLEVKATIDPSKGGEGHNGLGGWHLIAAYQLDLQGNIVFSTVQVAKLDPYRSDVPEQESDWKYQGSKEKKDTGTRRTETYVSTIRGKWKMRHGTVYLDPVVWPGWRRLKIRKNINIECPKYSPWCQ